MGTSRSDLGAEGRRPARNGAVPGGPAGPRLALALACFGSGCSAPPPPDEETIVPLELGLTVSTVERALSGQTVRLGALVSGGAAERRLAWTQQSGPPVALADAASMHPHFVAPKVDTATTLAFLVVATDRSGDRVERTVEVEVSPAPLEVFAGVTQTVGPNHTVALNGRLRGSADVVELNWIQTGGTPVALDDPTRLDPTFVAPNVGTFDTLVFELRATLPGGKVLTAPTQVEVQPAWYALEPGPDLLAVEGEEIILHATARGAFESPTWTWVVARGDADVDLPTDGVTSVTLGPPLNGFWEFEVRVEDLDGREAVGSVVVEAAPDPGTAELLVRTVDHALFIPGVPQRLHATASGGDGNYSYQWRDFSSLLSFAGSTTPNPRVTTSETGPVGGVVLQVEVTDGLGETATANVVYDISGPAGGLQLGADRTVAPGQRVYLSATAVGAELDGITWTKVLGPTLGVQGLDTPNPNFVAPDGFTEPSQGVSMAFRAETFELTTDTLHIDLDIPDRAPELYGPTTVVSGQRFALVASLDDPAAEATFAWWQLGDSLGVLDADGGATIEPVAPAVFEDTVVTYSVAATFPGGQRGVASVDVMVLARPSLTFSEPLPDVEVPGRARRMFVCDDSTRCDLDQVQVRCPPEAPFGLNEVRMSGDGSYEVRKACASAETCRARWWGTTRLDADCSALEAPGADLATLAGSDIVRICDICCGGESCNEPIFPTSDTRLRCDDAGCRPRD